MLAAVHILPEIGVVRECTSYVSRTPSSYSISSKQLSAHFSSASLTLSVPLDLVLYIVQEQRDVLDVRDGG